MVDAATVRTRRHAIYGCVLSLVIGWGWPGIGTAAMYQCVDRAGSSIFTDSPAQLDRCAPVAMSNTSTMTSTIHSLEPGQREGLAPIPPDASAPISPAEAPAQSPPHLSVIQPSPASPPDSVSATDSPTRCTPGLNPLNPFTVVCAPGSGNTAPTPNPDGNGLP
jgi:hypothetical protein